MIRMLPRQWTRPTNHRLRERENEIFGALIEESAVVGELLSSAGAAGRYSESRRRYAAVGYSDAPRIMHLIQFAFGMMDEDARSLLSIFEDVYQRRC